MRIEKIIIAVAFAFTFASVDAAYGVKWKPGDNDAVASAYLVAENAFTMRLRQPDGVIRKFYRDFAEPNKLYGPQPWVGEDVGNGIFKIITNPEFKGGRTGFVFQHGHLRRMILGRKDYQFDAMSYPAAAFTNSIESLWPHDLTKDEVREMYGSWNVGKKRLDLGFKNPNKGGCLCAELALIGLAMIILCGGRKWLFAGGVIVLVASFVLLLFTASRSGMLALVLGAFVLGAFRFRNLLSPKRICTLMAVVAIAIGTMIASGVFERFTTKLVDTSSEMDSFRLDVLRAAPRMMLDAPSGWGMGVSGRAFTTWYQRPDKFKAIRTLVSSHLTSLVEFGWVGRIAYVTLLAGLWYFLFSVASRKGSPLPVSLWTAFFLAGVFNSVMESPTLWILPLGSLALLFCDGLGRPTAKDGVRSLIFGAVAAAMVLGGMSIYGASHKSVPEIHASRGHVVVNGTEADIWAVDDGVVLGGGLVGKELRLFYGAFTNEAPIGLVWSVDDVPETAKHLVLVGKKCVDFIERVKAEPAFVARFKSILFLSPPFAASSLPISLSSRDGVKVIQGELAVARTADVGIHQPFLEVIPGAELYIPGWMLFASRMAKQFETSKNQPTENQEKK